MESSKFTWFPKLTETVNRLPEDQRGMFLWALIQYGTYGIEPDFSWPLDAVFIALKDDIDNSKRSMASGKEGGRGNKKGVKKESKPPFNNDETPLLDSEKGGIETPEAKPNQTIPNQTKPNKRETKRDPKFKPPTIDELRDYCLNHTSRGKPAPIHINFEKFMNHYQTNGWMTGRVPMKDWKAAARSWAIRDAEGRQNTMKGCSDEYSHL